MGHTDQFQTALVEIEKNLHYKLDPDNCEQLRTAIAFCGLERFRLCLKLVSLQGEWGPGRRRHDGNSRHQVLLALMRICAPHRGADTKLRTPAVAAAVAMQDQLDLEAMDAIARDGDEGVA